MITESWKKKPFLFLILFDFNNLSFTLRSNKDKKKTYVTSQRADF